MSLTLYGYFRSSATFRVRIALNIKALSYQLKPIHLLKDGGQQLQAEYLKLNPQGLVPILAVNDVIISQSSAIIEYLEESYPSPAMLPITAIDRAYVRSLVQMIACDIHPLNNLRVLAYLKNNFAINDAKASWYSHWLQQGFSAFEQRLKEQHKQSLYCFGQTPGIADAFLIPQVYNALRLNYDLHSYPLIQRIYKHCMQHPAFINAAPDKQPDAE